MTQDSEWTDLLQQWKGGQAAELPVDTLLAGVKRDHRKQVVAVAGELAAAALLVAVYTVELSNNPPPVIITLAVASLVFVAVWLTQLYRVTRGTWRAPAENGVSYLNLTLQRRRAAVRWLLFVQTCLWAALAFGMAWLPWKLSVDWEMYRAEPWRGLVGVGGYFFLLTALMWSIRRRLGRVTLELAGLEAVAPSMDA